MLRRITIAFVVLTVAVLPLTMTEVLAAGGAQQTAHAGGHLTMPLAGSFSGKSTTVPGATRDVGTGFFTCCGGSRIEGVQMVTFPVAAYKMTITTARGDTISLRVPPGSSTYLIDGGTGLFARVVGGSGHFSMQRSTSGQQGTFSGYLYGTVVLAF
jgi:hypothetical protein